MTNGVIIDAESGLLLIAMAGYRPNECSNVHTPHTGMHTHARTHSPSVFLSQTLTHIHTHFHFFQALVGALMHINLPHQLINLLTQASLTSPL